MTKEKMLSLYGFLCRVEPLLSENKIPDYLPGYLANLKWEIENEILLLMRESGGSLDK